MEIEKELRAVKIISTASGALVVGGVSDICIIIIIIIMYPEIGLSVQNCSTEKTRPVPFCLFERYTSAPFVIESTAYMQKVRVLH